MSDVINSPAHYAKGKIETIEAIEDWGLNYHRGNCVKYVSRAGKKDAAKEIEDLGKAKWYLEREIERLLAVKEGRDPVRPNSMNPKPTPAEYTSKPPVARFFCVCGHTNFFHFSQLDQCTKEDCHCERYIPSQTQPL